MPFCPKCKIQYREGFTICSDCKIPLVNSLNDVAYTEEIVKDEVEEAVEETIEVDAEKLKNIMENPPSEDELQEIKEYIDKQRKVAFEKQTYLTSKDKAKDLKSTGIMLIITGVIGVAVVSSIMAGFIPFFHISGVVKYVIYSIIDLFFVSFIYFGINALVSMKKLSNKVNEEESMNSDFIKWFSENVTKEAVDAKIMLTKDENTNYFMRNERIKLMVFHVFPDMENSFVENYIDEHYEDIFS